MNDKENLLQTNTTSWQDKFNGQHYDFRKSIKNNVLIVLYAEIVFLMGLIVFQGFHFWRFELNGWVFGLFVNGALLQTFFLIRHIVTHLFPSRHMYNKGK